MTLVRKFYWGFLFGGLVIALPFLASYTLLVRIGEIDVDRVSAVQIAKQDQHILFSSGLNQNVYAYKLKLMDAVNPEVIVIGSSRPMTIRQQFFTAPFMNLGGTVGSIEKLETLSSALADKRERPKLILVFVDPWWFNKEAEDINRVTRSKIVDFPAMISLPLAYSAANRIPSDNWVDASSRSRNLGIAAIVSGDGFSKDGSYHYVSTLFGRGPYWDEKFANTLWRIRNETDRFQKSNFADPKLVARGCSAIATIQKLVPNLVLIAPPFSDIVWKKMTEGGYGYIDQAHHGLTQCLEGVVFYDFSSPVILPGSSDCEFVDGYHGGDVTYARMLMLIGKSNVEVKKYLANDYIRKFVEINGGRAGSVISSNGSDEKEVDFLKIGCKK